jgi:hypothetical protein
MDAARHWARSRAAPKVQDERASDLAAFGAPASLVQAVSAPERASMELYAENQATVELFLACQTQWRVAPMGGVIGLDYPGVEALMRLRRVRDRPGEFARLQRMEYSALNAIDELEEA